MKKILTILIVCANMMGFSACDDFLKEEPKSQLTLDAGYYTTEAAIKATMKMLNIIENEYENNNG